MKVLFWNLNRKPLGTLVAKLAAEHEADLVVLAEPHGIAGTLLEQELSSTCEVPYCYHRWDAQKRLRFYSRYSIDSVEPISDSGGISVRKIVPPASESLIMVAVHSPSQLHWPCPDDRVQLAKNIREELESAEAKENHRRSFVVGDFNSDPFDKALTSSLGLHAVMTRHLASRESRQVLGADCHFLYNPMFSFLGDLSPGPPGSYFYRQSSSTCLFWHCFDQVLLRPALAKDFDTSSLCIPTSVGMQSLARKVGTPNNAVGSDHFPLVFRVV